MSELMCSQSKCRRKDEHIAELTVQNANMQENLNDLEAELAELKANSADAMNALMDEVHESKKNAAFFRCCALSGEVPKDGAEPHPKKEYKPPSKELLAALLQERGE